MMGRHAIWTMRAILEGEILEGYSRRYDGAGASWTLPRLVEGRRGLKGRRVGGTFARCIGDRREAILRCFLFLSFFACSSRSFLSFRYLPYFSSTYGFALAGPPRFWCWWMRTHPPSPYLPTAYFKHTYFHTYLSIYAYT